MTSRALSSAERPGEEEQDLILGTVSRCLSGDAEKAVGELSL